MAKVDHVQRLRDAADDKVAAQEELEDAIVAAWRAKVPTEHIAIHSGMTVVGIMKMLHRLGIRERTSEPKPFGYGARPDHDAQP